MSRLAIIVSALLLASVPDPAAAKPAAGSRSDARAVHSLHALAACIARKHERESRAVLALDFRSKNYSNRLRELGRRDASCITSSSLRHSEFKANAVLFAGGLAENLLRRDLGGGSLAARTAFNSSRPAIVARNGGEYFAICVVRTSPEDTWRLLTSAPAGPDEVGIIASMNATLSKCVPAGEQGRFTREALRSLLALAAYRLSEHNASPVPRTH